MNEKLRTDAIAEVQKTFFDELVARYRLPSRQPGDFTAAEFGVSINQSSDDAQKILEGLVKDQELVTLETSARNGRHAIIYRKKE